MKQAQKQVNEWTAQFEPQYFQPLEVIARLAEEVGELAREVNHRYGAKPKKSTEKRAEIEDEIADIIFTLCCLANPLGIDLDASWKRMMQKYAKRDGKRYKRK